ncbi:hypothetical protein WME90_34570 [Sorangium sp. So ce375]|uniref:hypothetical protein n=1 Tax=Sorangium sp. So ce375 TaxID=3133306 RepID=UPI003F5B4A12
MTFLLDANVLVDFQNAQLLSALVDAAQTLDMAVAEKVFDEVTLPKPDDSSDLVGKKRQAAAALDGARIRKIEILPGTQEATLMQALLAPLQTVKEKDQGEAASIAIAASDAGLLFVTGDKTAVLWALNELFHTGERVMRVPVFIRTLFLRGALPASAVKQVAARAASHGAVPSWWQSWLAAL